MKELRDEMIAKYADSIEPADVGILRTLMGCFEGTPPSHDELLDTLDWNRLRSGQYRSLNPANQPLFERFKELKRLESLVVRWSNLTYPQKEIQREARRIEKERKK